MFLLTDETSCTYQYSFDIFSMNCKKNVILCFCNAMVTSSKQLHLADKDLWLFLRGAVLQRFNLMGNLTFGKNRYLVVVKRLLLYRWPLCRGYTVFNTQQQINFCLRLLYFTTIFLNFHFLIIDLYIYTIDFFYKLKHVCFDILQFVRRKMCL
jgi:hypothetical protein